MPAPQYVTEIPRLQAEGKLEVIQMPPQGAESVQFNLRDPIVKDVRVREAIARGLDVATFTKDILKGVTQPADGVAMPTSWAYDPTVKMPSYDVEKAKQLLAEAGYSNGFTLNWSINSGNLFRQQFSTFAQAQLAKLNIKVNIMNPEWPVFLDSVMTGKYQVAHENTAGGLPDPDVWYYTFRTGGPGNVFGYSNPQVDTLLDQARTLTTQNDRKRIYVQVERILATDLPVFFAYFRPNPIVKNPKLKGLNPQPINPYFQIERWYKER